MNILDNVGWIAGKSRKVLTKEDLYLLDAMLLDVMCGEMTGFIMEEYKMAIEKNVINLMLQDLIRSEDYTISGVAAYTHVPEEVVYDIAIGSITNPTLDVSRKIIKLHMSARPMLYSRVMQKITEQYSLRKVDE